MSGHREGPVEPRRCCTRITPLGRPCDAHVMQRGRTWWCPVCGEERTRMQTRPDRRPA